MNRKWIINKTKDRYYNECDGYWQAFDLEGNEVKRLENNAIFDVLFNGGSFCDEPKFIKYPRIFKDNLNYYIWVVDKYHYVYAIELQDGHKIDNPVTEQHLEKDKTVKEITNV